MPRQDRTKVMLRKMLVENTGTHMLDSGGAYGRHWERNQGRDFDAEPAGALRFDIYNGQPEIDATLSLYHWLSDRLEYDASMDRRFQRWATRPGRSHAAWLELMEEFAEHVQGTGLYGEGHALTVNTYNNEDLLSQTIQYTYFELDHTPYVLLQVHGGCDVRGGYTRPRVFQVTSDEPTDIMDNAHAIIACTVREHYWYTDDGSYWYYEGKAGYDAGTQLEDYDASEDEADRGNGKLYIDDDHNGYCPKCGGLLRLYPR